MSSTVNKLSAAFVARNRKVSRKNDGGGLYLQTSLVGKHITKAWLFRFKLNGRKREMGLGSVNTYSLAEARERARQCRQLVDQGIDPIEARKARRATERAEAAKRVLFADAAADFIRDKRAGWHNHKHASQWEGTLRDYALPILGALPVAAIETAHIVQVLRPIWTEKPETAARVRGRIEAVLDWAQAGGFRLGENPARWKGHLENILAKRKPHTATRHHPALPVADVPAFMALLAATPGLPARAIELLVLTAVRLDEVRCASWAEIDLAAAVWAIPAARMGKTKREHRVPLARRAVAVLAALPGPEASPFVFPGLISPHKPLGASIVRNMLYRVSGLGPGVVSLHGFRSAFRDWCGDHTEVAREVAEAALAHTVGDQAERAYRRRDALAKRHQLMEAWADFCSGLSEA
jgi:integrase